MSDGNTGIHVTPVTKEEAVNLQSMFSKIAQALVDASSLPDQVKALQDELDTLRRDLQNKTTHAEELDKSLAEVRQQRDEARTLNDNQTRELSNTQAALSRANQTIDSQSSTINGLRENLSKAQHDRDDYGLQVLALEDQVKSWKAKAEEGRKKLSDMLSLFKAEEPEPEPIPAFIPPKEENAPNTPSTEPAHTAPADYPESTASAPSPAMHSDQSTDWPPYGSPKPEEASDAQAPHPVQATEEAPRYSDAWQPGAIWDSSVNKYRLNG